MFRLLGAYVGPFEVLCFEEKADGRGTLAVVQIQNGIAKLGVNFAVRNFHTLMVVSRAGPAMPLILIAFAG